MLYHQSHCLHDAICATLQYASRKWTLGPGVLNLAIHMVVCPVLQIEFDIHRKRHKNPRKVKYTMSRDYLSSRASSKITTKSLPTVSSRKRVPNGSSRSVQEKWRKRRLNLLKKANELSQMCDAQIYIVMLRDSKYYTYKSTEQDWPPSDLEIVSSLQRIWGRLTTFRKANCLFLSVRGHRTFFHNNSWHIEGEG